jgi:hypothetical protein
MAPCLYQSVESWLSMTGCATCLFSERKMTAWLLCLWCCMLKSRQHERCEVGMVSKALMDRPRHPTDAHGPLQRSAAAGRHRAAPPWARSPPALGTAPPEPPPSTPADALARTSSTCAAHAERDWPSSWCPALACLAHPNPTWTSSTCAAHAEFHQLLSWSPAPARLGIPLTIPYPKPILAAWPRLAADAT